MRLLYITDSLAVYGGVERVLTQKVNWLAGHNYEVCVLTVNQGAHPYCYPLHPEVKCYDLNILFYKQYELKGWKRFVKKHELSIEFQNCLHSRISVFSPNLIICTRLDYIRDVIQVKGTIPLVFESHSSCLCEFFENDSIFRKVYMWYLKLFLKKADIVVALTEGDAAEWRKYTPHVCVIPNVVSLNSNNVCSNCLAKSAIFVGRFTNQKDFDSLLQIWLLVHKKYPEWQLHIYGGYGTEKQRRMEQIDNICANIVVHEPSSAIFDKYKENSVLLLTSKYEPFGLVLPEAMSCGLPVVSFDCPYGPADIINDGVDGFLIKNRDIIKFADKVCALINNPDMRIMMGRAGTVSSRKYSTESIMPLWEELFNQYNNL